MKLKKVIVTIMFLLVIIFSLNIIIRFQYTESKVRSYLVNIEKKPKKIEFKKRIGNLPGYRNYLIEYKEKDTTKYYYYDYKAKQVKGEEQIINGYSKDLKTKSQ